MCAGRPVPPPVRRTTRSDLKPDLSRSMANMVTCSSKVQDAGSRPRRCCLRVITALGKLISSWRRAGQMRRSNPRKPVVGLHADHEVELDLPMFEYFHGLVLEGQRSTKASLRPGPSRSWMIASKFKVEPADKAPFTRAVEGIDHGQRHAGRSTRSPAGHALKIEIQTQRIGSLRDARLVNAQKNTSSW